MKLALAILVALVVAGSALAAPNNATLTIKHQTHGCHNWSFNGKTWHDPYHEPLWDTLERLEIPLGFHQASASSIPQLCDQWFGSNFGLRRAYGQPFGQMLGVGSFLGGGILERCRDRGRGP